MILRLTALLCFLLPFSLHSQDKMKFGKIPSADLKMTVYEKDTTAAAVVLGESGFLTFKFSGDGTKILLNIHRRVKILKRAGFDEGDVMLRYYSHEKNSNITGVKVKVFHPDGTDATLSKKEIFDEKLSDYYSAKKFSVPGLTEGSVIDYKYTLISESTLSLRRWFFQEDIPVRFSEYTLKIPKWYNYLKLISGGAIQQDTPQQSNEDIMYIGGGAEGGSRQGNVDFVTTRYYAADLPAMKEETFVTTMEDYLTNIQFQLSSINIPQQPIEPVLTTWNDVAEELLENESFGKQFLKKKNYDKASEAAATVMAAATTETEKMQAAYQFVLENIEWNEDYGFLTEETLDDAYQKKSGSGAEVNLLLLALLKEAGINANPVLISTRDNGKMIKIYPIVNQFNHVLVQAEADGEMYLLDATDKSRPIGFPEVNSLNKSGWMVSAQPQWIEIKAPGSRDIFLAELVLDTEGTLMGELKASCSGYSGFDERETATGDTEGKYWQARLAKNFVDAEVSDISYEGMKRGDKKMNAKMNCVIPDAAQVNGDFIYLSPIIYSNFKENPFKLEKRLYPVEIAFPFKEQVIINITVPEGYVVEEMPEQVNMALPGKGGKFQFLISQKDNKIQIVNKFSLKQLNFTPEEYQGIKDFFDMSVEKRGEQIVLKKVG